MPILIYKNTKLSKMKGVVLIDANIRMGMIRIGQYRVGTLDMKYHRTMWQCEGTVIFLGSAYIGSGTKLSISRGATLTFGDIFSVTGGSAIICDYAISFGKNCLLSWDILIMDTDFHRIFNDKGVLINPSKSIIIGNHVWIGCRNTILKGVSIPDNCVIAAGSKITKSFNENNCIIGSCNTERIIKTGIKWDA